MQSIPIEEAYESVKKLLYQQAGRMAMRYGMSFDDALSECHESFVLNYHRYDPSRGTKFSTRLVMGIQYRFLNLRKRRLRQKADAHLPLNETLLKEVVPPPSICLQALGELSRDAQLVVRLCLEAPTELGVARTPTELWRSVVRHLRAQRWSSAKISATRTEIETLFRQIWRNA